ncbi:MAG: dual specificity protein phosphatase family protein [Chloroflexi bacterium]|nr:dual specificity protein phosphatase family protein [Chloroflexota bacterium]
MKIDWIEAHVLAAGPIPDSARDVISLHRQGIRALITLTEKPLTANRDITFELIDGLQLACFHLPVRDFYPPALRQVADMMRLIEQMRAQQKPVFLHCYAGIGRTGTMLHAYFLNKGLGLEEAKQRVLATRPDARYGELSDVQRAFLEAFASNL